MFHLEGYADQRRVLKLFTAGARCYKSSVLPLRYAPLTILFPPLEGECQMLPLWQTQLFRYIHLMVAEITLLHGHYNIIIYK